MRNLALNIIERPVLMDRIQVSITPDFMSIYDYKIREYKLKKNIKTIKIPLSIIQN